MIRAGDVVQRTRLVAGDMQAGRYSDYEVYAALNAAVDVLCEGLRRYFSPELVRRAVLTPKDGRCALPEGFLYLSEVDCDSDWRIEGGFFVCEDAAEIAYGKHPGRLSQTTDFVDLADGFLIHLASVAASLLRGEEKAANEKAEAAAYEKTADKRGPVAEPAMWS